ncbi:MAG: potassium channel family protein [Sphingomonas sp.]
MPALLIAAGSFIVALTMLDVFFTVLFPASRHGPIRQPLSIAIWGIFHVIGRTTKGSKRRNLLSYSGPVVITATMVLWFLLLAIGFAMIFKPGLGTGLRASSGPTDTDWVTALYYSSFNLTTLGVGDIAPVSGPYRILTIVAAAVGFAYFSMAITYFLSVYSNLSSRNAFAQGLHHLTGRSGDAAQLIANLSDDGELDDARNHLTTKASFLREIYQSHRFYPVLRHFHYREPFYALPRILLTALDTAALLRSSLDRDHYGRLLRSSALLELDAAAHDLMTSLLPRIEGRPPSAGERHEWERRYHDGVRKLANSGLQLRPDGGGLDDYISFRAAWDQPLHELAADMLYEWQVIEEA